MKRRVIDDEGYLKDGSNPVDERIQRENERRRRYGKLVDPLPKQSNRCPNCGQEKQPLKNRIPHYCPPGKENRNEEPDTGQSKGEKEADPDTAR